MNSYKQFWLEARKTIRRFKYLDDSDVIFGARALRYHPPKGHNYKIDPVMKPSEIDAIEAKFNISLPEELKDYLLYFGAGGAGPDYGVKNFRHSFETFSYDKPFVTPSIDKYGDNDPIEDFSGLIYFGTAGCGADYYLELVSENIGEVWVTWSSGDSCTKLGNFIDFYSNWLEESEKILKEYQNKQINNGFLSKLRHYFRFRNVKSVYSK